MEAQRTSTQNTHFMWFSKIVYIYRQRRSKAFTTIKITKYKEFSQNTKTKSHSKPKELAPPKSCE